MSSITVLRVDSQLAMQIVSPASPKPDTELIKATAHVVDDNNAPQAGITVYWSSQGVNPYQIFYYSTDTLKPLDGAPPQSITGADGTTSVYVGSTDKVIATIQASLQPLTKELKDTDKAIVKTNNIAACTFLPDGGDLPEPTLVEQDDGYVEPDSDTDPTYWPQSYQDTQPVFPGVGGPGAKFVPWLSTSNDPNGRGDELGGIRNYGQQIGFKVQYYKMATEANAQNQLAYMVYANYNGRVSRIWSFQAAGTGVVWPDPDHTASPDLGMVQYVPSTTGQPVPMPLFLDYSYFDQSTGTLNFAIPAYQGLSASDDIAIKAYVNAWYQGEANNQVFTITKTRTGNYQGSDFANGYLRFFLTRNQLVDFCQFAATQKYGCMMIQYVVNNTLYSPYKDPPVLINFCDGSQDLGEKARGQPR
jgi:hypothetical protein